MLAIHTAILLFFQHDSQLNVFLLNFVSLLLTYVAPLLTYSADLNYPDKTNKTWIFKRVFLKLG